MVTEVGIITRRDSLWKEEELSSYLIIVMEVMQWLSLGTAFFPLLFLRPTPPGNQERIFLSSEDQPRLRFGVRSIDHNRVSEDSYAEGIDVGMQREEVAMDKN